MLFSSEDPEQITSDLGLHCLSMPFRSNIGLNTKVSQLLLKCYFLLSDPNTSLRDMVIDKSNDLPSIQQENQTSETFDCRS